jgi:GTP-binding protein
MNRIKIPILVYNCTMKIISAKFVKGVVGPDAVMNDGVAQYAFIGRSNVGKSSLINAIAGTNDMARVGKKPGKTTEINFFLIKNSNDANDSFYLVDLPGYGFAKASLAARAKLRELIIWYLTQSGARPQKVVLVVDSKVGMTDFDKDTLEVLRGENHPFLVVANKIDKLTQAQASASIKAIQTIVGDALVIPFSSETKRGLERLAEAIFG